MVLGSQVEWAIHCCSVLSGIGSDERVSTKTLSEFHGIPKEYLSKALQQLAQAGLINGSLGPTGGYRLSKSPDEISFLDIVEAIEGRTNTFQCTEIRANNPCLKNEKVKGICGVARIMFQADEAWRQELRKTSLRDLQVILKKNVSKELLERSSEWLKGR